ncbi:cyclin-D5-3-like [Solanum dulcamara]|uniref:cyclin-D5-3-like n=1 Tax=Solanum dulcamara TaxID=45834 RepID=UPI0024856178|nr:cyclin-D5-3-like [Solanum dulcamara]
MKNLQYLSMTIGIKNFELMQSLTFSDLAEQEFRLSRRTLYRAVIYLDKFLATRLIANGELWAVRILTVTCLSLSAKMDEVPPLESYNTSVNAIRRMEILILNEFNWKMNCVTPFAFTNAELFQE